MLACNCLNIIIEGEFNDFQKINTESLDLGEFEKRDEFFKQELQRATKFSKTTKKISALVETRSVGSQWLVHHCINCNVHTHAINQNNSAGYVLVSCKLLTKEAIADIKKSQQYSSIFDIKIIELSPSSDLANIHDAFHSDSDTIINSLRQRVNELINKETVAVEEKIKKYTEDQYNGLIDYKDKVLREHHILKMRILECQLNADLFDNYLNTNVETNTHHSNLQSTMKTRETNVPEDSNVTNTNRASLTTKSKPIINNKSSVNKTNFSRSVSHREYSIDTEEVLFPLEDMDDELLPLDHSDCEESDQDDLSMDNNTESATQQQHQRPRQHSDSQAQQLAKSLPVNIPVFMTAHQNHYDEDNEDELPDESMDIAASIKALAKSIQGGTVFGELPRPRFSSQI